MHYIVQLLSLVWLSVTPWTAARQTSLFLTISQSLLKPHVHWVSEATQPSRPLSSPCVQSFWTSGSFPISHFFTSGGQIIGASASASVLPMNIQDRFYIYEENWNYFSLKYFIIRKGKKELKWIKQVEFNLLDSS